MPARKTYLRAIVLALALSCVGPEVALCQEAEAIEELEQEQARSVRRRRPRRRTWSIIWGAAATIACIALPVGVYTLISQMRPWRIDQDREKAPWERAMAEYKRNRLS